MNEACPRTGKRMLTRKEAMTEKAWWRRHRFARMNHYRCSSCGKWHIGNNHRKPKVRR